MVEHVARFKPGVMTVEQMVDQVPNAPLRFTRQRAITAEQKLVKAYSKVIVALQEMTEAAQNSPNFMAFEPAAPEARVVPPPLAPALRQAPRAQVAIPLLDTVEDDLNLTQQLLLRLKAFHLRVVASIHQLQRLWWQKFAQSYTCMVLKLIITVSIYLPRVLDSMVLFSVLGLAGYVIHNPQLLVRALFYLVRALPRYLHFVGDRVSAQLWMELTGEDSTFAPEPLPQPQVIHNITLIQPAGLIGDAHPPVSLIVGCTALTGLSAATLWRHRLAGHR